jgi:hypothetical protein
MDINNRISFSFNGFKGFVYDTDYDYNESNFIGCLQDDVVEILKVKNGEKSLDTTDKYIPLEEIDDYDLIDIYGDVYRDKNYKNEVFLKLRIKPTPAGIERIKNNTSDKKAKEELEKNSLITEFVSQPIAVRSKDAYAQLIRNIEDKYAFFKRYILGTAQWKSSDKPKFGWDRNLIENCELDSNQIARRRVQRAFKSYEKLSHGGGKK